MADAPTLPDTTGEKRIVVQHASGIFQICALVSAGQPDEMIPADMSGWEYDVQLVASKARYWLYRPVGVPIQQPPQKESE